MPHISILMSASSSMTRISCAISCRFHRFDVACCVREPCVGLAEDHDHPRAAARTVLEHELAMMILHDLFYYGEPESCTFRARRHIGFGQPLASFLRQAAPVILDCEQHPSRLRTPDDQDTTGRRI